MAKPSCSGLDTSKRWPSLGDGLDRKLDADIFPITHLGNMEPSGKDNQYDRLSNLPDDIVLNIVERLDIADAARTSILSRRWKQIPAMLSKIVITVSSFEPWRDIWSILKGDDIARARANATMHEVTRSILESRTASDLYTIHVMCLEFYLGEESTIPIGQTVANAMATRKVGSAEFTILAKVRARCTVTELLTQGSQFMSFVDACPNAFGGLTRLNLERLRLGESEFPKVFSICKQLKDLRLYCCDMGILSLLELEHPQLCKVELAACDFEKVDLKWLPKLTVLSFEYWISKNDPFSLGFVPLLQNVSISNIGLSLYKMHKLSQLLGKASSISDLHLNFKCERIWVKPEGRKQLSMVFRGLRYVNLMNISEECELNWTMFILQGAPTLKELCVTVQDHFCEMIWGLSRKSIGLSEEKKDKEVVDWETSLGFKHTSLAVFRIFGFQAQDKFVSYIKSVMEAAVNLEKIYLHDKPVCRRCRRRVRRTSMYPRTWKHKSSIREEINKGTRPPVGIHFPK
uniref:Uncharacterized protein n=1 Tax=Avena sativa TaxID=4498 RepID=A0ACD5TB10_AVESA